MKCCGCFKNLKETNSIKCTALDCGKGFCHLCINTSSIPHERKKSWKCPDCTAALRKGGDNTLTPVRFTIDAHNVTLRKKSDSTQDLTVSEVQQLTAEVRLLTKEISSLKDRLEQATQSLSRCHERLDEFGTAITSNSNRIMKLEESETEVKTLKSKVSELQIELGKQEQSNLRNELELSGIPETPNENLHHIVLVAARKIGVTLEDSDIDWVTRAGPRSLNTVDPRAGRLPRPVVARLVRRATRDLLLKNARTRKNITSEDLDIPGNSHKVYYNERLTKGNRLLFWQARSKTKQHGYAYCWCSQGSIYIRQREGKAAILIGSYADIERVFGTPANANVL